MDAYKLYRKFSKVQLLAMQAEISNNPANANTIGLYLHILPARKKLNNIAQAISFHLSDQRMTNGKPVIEDGYSGRKSNRR